MSIGACPILPHMPDPIGYFHNTTVDCRYIQYVHYVNNTTTGGSHLSHTAVKPDSCLAQIFCIISFLYNLINLMQISTDKPDN